MSRKGSSSFCNLRMSSAPSSESIIKRESFVRSTRTSISFFSIPSAVISASRSARLQKAFRARALSAAFPSSDGGIHQGTATGDEPGSHFHKVHDRLFQAVDMVFDRIYFV
jgi:hypothetical protein